MPHLGPGTLIEGCYGPAKKLKTPFCGLLSTQVCLQEYKPCLQRKIVNSSFWQSPSLRLTEGAVVGSAVQVCAGTVQWFLFSKGSGVGEHRCPLTLLPT